MDGADHLGEPVKAAKERSASHRWRAILVAVVMAAGVNASAHADPALEKIPDSIRDVTPPHMTRTLLLPGMVLERLPALVPPPAPPKPPQRIVWPRAEALSAGAIASQGQQIEIAGIAGLAADAVCAGGDAEEWPCGNFARAAFARLLRQRSVACDPAVADAQGLIVTRCSVGGHDIATWLVARGWALPRDPGLYPAAQDARAAGLGQWSAGPPAY
jgi:endonuclease YncB( thermonuclease family)